MRIGIWARLLLATAPLLTGCGLFKSITSSTTTTPTTLSSGKFYVLNQTAKQVVAFNIVTGVLTQIGAYTLGAEPFALAVAPNGAFLYVSTSAGIYLYTIGSNGALTLGNSGGVISVAPAFSMQVDATNSWLVDAVNGVAQINAIAISPTTGTITSAIEQTAALPTYTVQQLTISPNDSNSCSSCYVFIALGAGGTAVVHFNPGNTNPFGFVANIGVENTGGGAYSVAVDPGNQLLYVGETDALPSVIQSGGLRVFTIAAATITELSGSPFSSQGIGPSSILPTADYVYVANESVDGITAGNIASFSVVDNAGDYSLALIGTVSTGDSPIGLATDSTGNFLLTVNYGGNPDLDAYTMSSGILTTVLSVATGSDPVGAVAIAAAP